MVATFCLRLAFGMIASLLVLDPKPIPPRFFRVQFLTALGLLAVAGYFLFQSLYRGQFHPTFANIVLGAFCLSLLSCFAGAVVWHLRDAPGGRTVTFVTVLALSPLLILVNYPLSIGIFRLDSPLLYLNELTSAAVLGTSVSAMLLGHSYLISPAMTIAPLRRMLTAATIALALRVILVLWGLWFWTAERPLINLDIETLLWLSARWLLGILAPLVLGWMAWETARIRSTQSATGILYVVVIVTFLGELTSLLLLEKTGSVL